MLKRKIDDYIRNYYETTRNALLVTGARQTVQECPEIVTAIKFLVDEGSYRYILSGSLLGVELKDLRSEPVGYMGVKDMYPLDFEEFISCVGISDAVIGALRPP